MAEGTAVLAAILHGVTFVPVFKGGAELRIEGLQQRNRPGAYNQDIHRGVKHHYPLQITTDVAYCIAVQTCRRIIKRGVM